MPPRLIYCRRSHPGHIVVFCVCKFVHFDGYRASYLHVPTESGAFRTLALVDIRTVREEIVSHRILKEGLLIATGNASYSDKASRIDTYMFRRRTIQAEFGMHI